MLHHCISVFHPWILDKFWKKSTAFFVLLIHWSGQCLWSSIFLMYVISGTVWVRLRCVFSEVMWFYVFFIFWWDCCSWHPVCARIVSGRITLFMQRWKDWLPWALSCRQIFKETERFNVFSECGLVCVCVCVLSRNVWVWWDLMQLIDFGWVWLSLLCRVVLITEIPEFEIRLGR